MIEILIWVGVAAALLWLGGAYALWNLSDRKLSPWVCLTWPVGHVSDRYARWMSDALERH